MTITITSASSTIGITAASSSIAITQYQASYDWYVDSVNGDDDNAGDEFAPFASLAKLMTVWTAGQSVGLAGGSTWREELFIPGDNCIIGKYGGGDDPLIDASGILTAGEITKTAGQTNVYQFTVTLPNVPSQPAFPQLWEDDKALTAQTSISNVNSNAGTRYYTGTTGEVTCYFHATDSSDPTASGKVYTYAMRLSSVFGAPAYLSAMADGVTISNIRTQKNLSQNGSLLIGTNATLTDVSCYYGSKHNAYVQEGTTWTGGTIQDAYFNSSATLIVANMDTPSGEPVTFSNLSMTMTALSPVPANVAPMNSHNNTSGSFGAITVSGCTFTGFRSSGQTFAFNNTDTIVMTNPAFVNCAYGVAGPINPSATFTLTGMTWTSNITERAVNWNGTLAQLIMSDCTLTLDSASTAGLLFITGNPVVSVTNCAFKSNITTGSRIAVYIQACAGNVTLNNNTYNTGTGSWTYHYGFTATASGMTWASDNNTFKATTPNFSIFGTTYASLATYRAAVSPRDANSTAG